MTALALLAVATPALAEEVNLYSYRQPELLKPLTDGFTEATGIDVNVAYLSSGMIERLQAEGTAPLPICCSPWTFPGLRPRLRPV